MNSEKKVPYEKIIKTAACMLPALLGLFLVLSHGGFGTGIYRYTPFLIIIPFMIAAFVNLVCLIESDGEVSKKILRYALIFGMLFGISTDMGYQLQRDGFTLPGVKGKLIILITGCTLSFLFLPVSYRLFRLAEGLYKMPVSSKDNKLSGIKVFFISLIALEICWLPVFLAFYPAIMSYDFNRQSQEALKGFIWFYEYQPLSHTFLIRQFFLLGSKLGSFSAGMAAYAVFQSLILASSISAGLAAVYKRSGKIPAFIWGLIFALLPFNPVLAISITKDIIFSAFFLFVLLIVLNMTESEKVRPLMCVLFVICGIINILFRNNAPYGLIFLLPAFLLTGIGLKKKILYAVLTLVMVVCGMSGKTLIRTSMNAIEGSKIEMYSVPLMQMVRTVYYQSENLTDEQEEILHKYVGDGSWGNYNPSISDAFKADTSSEAWIENKKEMIKDYVKIGKAYPNDYIDAFLELTVGYWFIDDKTHAEMLDMGDDSGYGLLFTFNASKSEVLPDGIPDHSYLPGVLKLYRHIVNGNSYYNWPVLSVFFKPALYFWILVYAVFAAIYKRSRKCIVLFAYPVFYMLTMLLGPCVHFRYIYPFVVSAPLFISFVLSESEGKGR